MTLHESQPSPFPDLGRLPFAPEPRQFLGEPPVSPARPQRPQRALYEHAELGPLRVDGTTTEDCFDRLARLAEPEKWSAARRDETWVLREYLEQTFERLHVQRRVLASPDGARSVFHTGLATSQQEAIYGLCVPGHNADGAPWQLEGWFTENDPRLSAHFPELPDLAVYTEDPAELVYDWRCPLAANPRALLESKDVLGELPGPLRTNPYLAGLVMEGAVRRAEARARRHYRAAVPAWDPAAERVVLLLPLALSAPETVDVALVVAKEGGAYRGLSILGLDLAYARARLLSRPEDWIKS